MFGQLGITGETFDFTSGRFWHQHESVHMITADASRPLVQHLGRPVRYPALVLRLSISDLELCAGDDLPTGVSVCPCRVRVLLYGRVRSVCAAHLTELTNCRRPVVRL